MRDIIFIIRLNLPFFGRIKSYQSEKYYGDITDLKRNSSFVSKDTK